MENIHPWNKHYYNNTCHTSQESPKLITVSFYDDSTHVDPKLFLFHKIFHKENIDGEMYWENEYSPHDSVDYIYEPLFCHKACNYKFSCFGLFRIDVLQFPLHMQTVGCDPSLKEEN